MGLDKYIEQAKDENGYVRIDRLIPHFAGRKSSGMMKEVMEHIKKNKIPYIIMDFGNNFQKIKTNMTPQQEKALQEAKDRVAKRYTIPVPEHSEMARIGIKEVECSGWIRLLHYVREGKNRDEIIDKLTNEAMLEYASASSEETGNDNYSDLFTAIKKIDVGLLKSAKNLITRYINTHPATKQFSESEVYTAINMARGVTFQTDREPKFHHTNKEIVEYLESVKPLTPSSHPEVKEGDSKCTSCGWEGTEDDLEYKNNHSITLMEIKCPTCGAEFKY